MITRCRKERSWIFEKATLGMLVLQCFIFFYFRIKIDPLVIYWVNFKNNLLIITCVLEAKFALVLNEFIIRLAMYILA